MSADELFGVLAVVLVVLGAYKIVMSSINDNVSKLVGVLSIVAAFVIQALTQ